MTTPVESPESRERWRQSLAEYAERRERTRRLRAQLQAARDAGKAARHARRLHAARGKS